MKKCHVLNCMFSTWYSSLKNVTIKSRVLDLPADFIDYLLSDGVVLPAGSEPPLSREGLEGDSDDEVDWETDQTNVATAPSFPELDQKIKQCIEDLGGAVFPKLNWSSPKDASWVAFNNTLKCTCPADIYLLLKSSNFVAHDLTQPFGHCEDHTEGGDAEVAVPYQLVLRKWYDLNPGKEFRCFIKNRTIIGISQRSNSDFYPFIGPEKDDIITDITDFYTDKIHSVFPDSDYVMDVYRKEQGKVYVIDFNPFGEVTDALLFTWDELGDQSLLNNTQSPVLRYVQNSKSIHPNPHQVYSVPEDFLHLTTGEDPNKLMDLLQLKVQSQNNESSSDDDTIT